jgi:hypothetical protein
MYLVKGRGSGSSGLISSKAQSFTRHIDYHHLSPLTATHRLPGSYRDTKVHIIHLALSALPYRLLPYRLLPYRLLPYRLLPYRLLPCRLCPVGFALSALPCRLLLYRLLPYRLLPCRLCPVGFCPIGYCSIGSTLSIFVYSALSIGA